MGGWAGASVWDDWEDALRLVERGVPLPGFTADVNNVIEGERADVAGGCWPWTDLSRLDLTKSWVESRCYPVGSVSVHCACGAWHGCPMWTAWYQPA